MQELLLYIVKNLVSEPDDVAFTEEMQGKTKIVKVQVNAKDLGAVIGHGGTVANAIRTVVKSLATDKLERMVIKFDAK